MTKRILNLFTVLIMVISLAGVLPAVTASAETYGDYEYTVLDDGTVEITGYTGNATELEIPSEIDGKPVISIGNSAFSQCESLTSITIPDSVKSIKYCAFAGCTSLTSITIPNSVTSIEYSVFGATPWLEKKRKENPLVIVNEILIDGNTCNGDVIIPHGVTNIAPEAFLRCGGIKSVTIPDTVTSIGGYAFAWCGSLTSVTIPNSVTSFSYFAFFGTPWLENKQNENPLVIVNGILIDGTACSGDITIPNSVTSIGDHAFEYCEGLTSITIPDSVTSIGYGVFYKCYYLESITIPSSVTSIGDYAFSYCENLTSITIPNSVTSIGDYAFENCYSLASIKIPFSVISIGDSAFSDCESLTEINVDSNNENYSSQDGVLFNYDKTELIQYPKGNIQTTYTIPDSVTSIGDKSFYNCDNLISIAIPDSVANIGRDAFEFCSSLTSITIGNSVTSIGDLAFWSCENLTSITIGNSVTSIGHSAFWYCTSLTSITIPNSVISIGDSAFSDCESLTEINVDSNNKYYSSQDGVLFNYNKTELIKYPIGKTQTTYTIPNGVTSIGHDALEWCSILTSITIPNSVTSIEDSAFKGCNNDLIIKCYKDSYAEQYAKENNIKYELIADNNPPQNTDNTLNTQTTNNNSNKPNSTTVPTASPINKAKTTPITTKVTVTKPAKVKSVKLIAKKKKLNVKWKKVSGATGYEVMYATNNKFTKGKKTVTVKKNKVTIKNLKPKKKYFVKVRAYKTVNGNTYYGKWSKVVKKKVK